MLYENFIGFRSCRTWNQQKLAWYLFHGTTFALWGLFIDMWISLELMTNHDIQSNDAFISMKRAKNCTKRQTITLFDCLFELLTTADGPILTTSRSTTKTTSPHPITQIVSQTTSFHFLFVKDERGTYLIPNIKYLETNMFFWRHVDHTINVAQIIMVMHFYP